MAEVQENVETKKSGGTHDIIKTAGFMSDIGYGEYHINRSEINNRVTVTMSTASYHEQGRNSKNRSAKIRWVTIHAQNAEMNLLNLISTNWDALSHVTLNIISVEALIDKERSS